VCDRRLSGAGAAPDPSYCVFALWETVPSGSGVTEKQTDVRQSKRHKEQHSDRDEAVLAEDEPLGGHWPALLPEESRDGEMSTRQK